MLKSGLAASALALGGCATGQWHHATATQSQFYNDRVACMQLANKLHPPRIETTFTGIAQPAQTQCSAMGNTVNCTTRPATQAPAMTIDVNDRRRRQEVDACLQARGYFVK